MTILWDILHSDAKFYRDIVANRHKMWKCNIDKRITFHQARHNFGSLITLSQGVPLESVCKMMGHRNISTTQLYAKLTHQKVNEDIKRISMKVKSKYEIPEWNKGSDNVKNIHYGQMERGNQ